MSYSRFWEPPTRNFHERQTAWINSCFYSHEGFCGCGDFSLHLFCIVHSITRDSPTEAIAAILSQQLNKQKCLTFTNGDALPIAGPSPKPGDGAGDALENLRDGELEELFTEDITTPTKEDPPAG